VPVGGSKIVVRFSMGAVVVEPGEMSVKDILIRGDAAVRAAKVRGGDRLLRFSEEMLSERSDRLEIEESLVEAAADPEQFLVMYQAQIDMASGEVVGAEALLRWRHPARGLLHPDRFLEVAEETGLIVPIDFHVLRTALGELARFRQKGLSVRMGVNFSARTLAEPDLVASVSEALAEADVPGDLLEIEMTESAAVHDPEALGAVLEGLGELGVSVAVDDVGTGYASLALLHKLPARRLKIDRSFVQRITEDQAARSVVEAVLLLADRLGQSVVAEGIESKEQALELRSLGCRLAQGFLFSPPSSAAVVEQLARTGIRLPGSRLLFDKTHAGEGPPLNGSPQAGDAPYEGAPRRAATQRARHRRKRGQ
jgi:EAL domain-containing protein (putative c-di-GMP-specific phosphodiesterase class I)